MKKRKHKERNQTTQSKKYNSKTNLYTTLKRENAEMYILQFKMQSIYKERRTRSIQELLSELTRWESVQAK